MLACVTRKEEMDPWIRPQTHSLAFALLVSINAFHLKRLAFINPPPALLLHRNPYVPRIQPPPLGLNVTECLPRFSLSPPFPLAPTILLWEQTRQQQCQSFEVPLQLARLLVLLQQLDDLLSCHSEIGSGTKSEGRKASSTQASPFLPQPIHRTTAPSLTSDETLVRSPASRAVSTSPSITMASPRTK